MAYKQTLAGCLALVIYVLLGGLLFSELEGEHESNSRNVIQNILLNLTNSCVSMNEVKFLLRSKTSVFEELIALESNATGEFWKWNYMGSIFFSFVMLTTIGYGNQTPATWGGRAACVAYGMLGIPLFFVVMNLVANESKALIRKMEGRLPERIKHWPFIISAVIITALGFLVITLPAVLIAEQEGWTFGETVYFSFVTLSTVGFGDYVPGNRPGGFYFYRLFVVIWMFIGLTYLAGIRLPRSFSGEIVQSYKFSKSIARNSVQKRNNARK